MGDFSVSSKFQGTILQSLDSRPPFAPYSELLMEGLGLPQRVGVTGGDSDGGRLRTREGQGSWAELFGGISCQATPASVLRATTSPLCPAPRPWTRSVLKGNLRGPVDTKLP